MYAGVSAAKYGNMDTSSSLISFWLGDGSLKITPKEQVDFLYKLFTYRLPFSSKNINITKEIIKQDTNDSYIIYGKTGSCDNNGWFVGFAKLQQREIFFSFHVRESGVSGQLVKDYALPYLKDYLSAIK
jgi:beta-lactamase class D